MGVNSLPKTVTRQRRGCDLNPGPSAPESSTLTTRLPSHPPKRWGLVRSIWSKRARTNLSSANDSVICQYAGRVSCLRRYGRPSVQ